MQKATGRHPVWQQGHPPMPAFLKVGVCSDLSDGQTWKLVRAGIRQHSRLPNYLPMNARRKVSACSKLRKLL